MKKILLPLLSLLFAIVLISFELPAQSVTGIWKTIDDKTGDPKSHVKVYKKDGKLYGKIVQLIDPKFEHCTECPEPYKDEPLVGLKIMWDLEDQGDEWDEGEIMDPNNGKIYRCKLWLEGEDKLKVRGYLGFSMFGRTQEWIRVK